MSKAIFGVDPKMKELEEDEETPEIIRRAVLKVNNNTAAEWVSMIASLLCSVGMGVAGVMMIRMQMYPVAITGAVLAMIPCMTITGCCGVGQGVGIWALVILMNGDVKQWFQQAPVRTPKVPYRGTRQQLPDNPFKNG